jgi:hypothetical protein
MKLQNGLYYLLTFFILQLVFVPKAIGQEPSYDLIQFENRDSIPQLVSDSTLGIWQIGVPQKDFFGEAYSPPLAIMTDTILPFLSDTSSSFVVVFSNLYPGSTNPNYTGSLCFWHKLQSEFGEDFAQVALSIDGGNFWSDFTNDNGGYQMGNLDGAVFYSGDFYDDWYESDIDSLYGFTGTFEEYRKTCFDICWYLPVLTGDENYPPDSIWVKFNFIAGPNAEQNAGWIVDDISLDFYDCGSSVAEHDLPPLEVYPQPAQETLNFLKPENTSNQAVLSIYNSVGQNVKQLPYQGDNLSIDIQNWSGGLYTYVLRDKGVAVNVGKIVVGR